MLCRAWRACHIMAPRTPPLVSRHSKATATAASTVAFFRHPGFVVLLAASFSQAVYSRLPPNSSSLEPTSLQTSPPLDKPLDLHTAVRPAQRRWPTSLQLQRPLARVATAILCCLVGELQPREQALHLKKVVQQSSA